MIILHTLPYFSHWESSSNLLTCNKVSQQFHHCSRSRRGSRGRECQPPLHRQRRSRRQWSRWLEIKSNLWSDGIFHQQWGRWLENICDDMSHIWGGIFTECKEEHWDEIVIEVWRPHRGWNLDRVIGILFFYSTPAHVRVYNLHCNLLQ